MTSKLPSMFRRQRPPNATAGSSTHSQPGPSNPAAATPPGWKITYNQQIPNPHKLQKTPSNRIYQGDSAVSATNFVFLAHTVLFEGGGRFFAVAYAEPNGQGAPTTLGDGSPNTSSNGFRSFMVSERTAVPSSGSTAPTSTRRPAQDPLDIDPTEGLDDDEDEDDIDTQAQRNAQAKLNQQAVAQLHSLGLEPPPLPTNPAGQAKFDRLVRQAFAQAGIPDLPPVTQDSIEYEKQLLQAAQAHASQSHDQGQSHLGTSTQQVHPAEQYGAEEAGEGEYDSNEVHDGHEGFEPDGEEDPEHFTTHEEGHGEDDFGEEGEFEGEEGEGEGEGDFEGEGPDEDGYFHAI